MYLWNRIYLLFSGDGGRADVEGFTWDVSFEDLGPEMVIKGITYCKDCYTDEFELDSIAY